MRNERLSFFQFLFVHKVPPAHSLGFGLMAGGLTGLIVDTIGNIDHKFSGFLYLAFIVVGILAIPPLLAQYRSITSVLQSGIEVSGKIVDLYFAFGQGYVTYEYAYHGQKYRASDNINRTPKTKKLQIGQAVILRLNHNDLKQAYIPEIYM